MTIFTWPRFQRLFLNDLHIQGKKILMGSAGVLAVGLVLYLSIMSGAQGGVVVLYQPFFSIALMLGGTIMTSMVFNDIHHPDERYFYLLQPVSNFERLLSRYLITGPLFYIYFVALYYLFEIVAGAISNLLIGESSQFFDLTDWTIQGASKTYFEVHAIVLLGAVFFRSHSLAKTMLTLAALIPVCLVVFWVSMRLIYWDYFPSLFSLLPREETSSSFNPASWPAYVYWVVGIACYLWVLFIAYTTLQDHEA